MLPAKWRKAHGIQPESELLVELRDNCLVMQTREQAVREAQEMVRTLVPACESLVDELFKQRRREASEELASIARDRSPGSRPVGKAAKASGASRPSRRRARARH